MKFLDIIKGIKKEKQLDNIIDVVDNPNFKNIRYNDNTSIVGKAVRYLTMKNLPKIEKINPDLAEYFRLMNLRTQLKDPNMRIINELKIKHYADLLKDKLTK